MSYTLGQAAKATGKSKPTISRAIKSGKISAAKGDDGSYTIDPAELHRVFPPLSPASNDTGTDETPAPSQSDALLQQEIEHLRRQLEDRDSQISDLKEDRDQWRKQADKITALIEDQSSKPQGFWKRLTGK
ncbi:MAG: helix-turn-helix domain-containing protein [Ahrensia sp.]|nr:helix-turn-helix domain-containing protein [Ahrensia sp.]